MNSFTIDRCGFIVRPFLGSIQIINKATFARAHVEIVTGTRARRMIRKNDRHRIFCTNWTRYATEWCTQVFPNWDDDNFTAMCEHFTDGRNFYDRGNAAS